MTVHNIAVTWAPERKRRRGRPKTTWRHTVEKEWAEAGWQSWEEAKTIAANRDKWRDSVQASQLYVPRGTKMIYRWRLICQTYQLFCSFMEVILWRRQAIYEAPHHMSTEQYWDLFCTDLRKYFPDKLESKELSVLCWLKQTIWNYKQTTLVWNKKHTHNHLISKDTM